jgi:glycosyltransferase involved in cell wall biosynthesis
MSFLKRAFDSIFCQTSPLWNLIVIHDGIAADVRQVLEELVSYNDKRIKVVDNQARYISGALNTGMRSATTPYVCALHCDDLLHESALEILDRNITRFPDIDFFYSSRMAIDENDRPISGIMPAVEFRLTDFKKRSPVKHLHCWKVSSALQIGGIDESLGPHGADDYDFPWCMAEAGFSFKTIPECLYYYRDHREYHRLTTHVPLDVQVNELRAILKKHGIGDEEIENELHERSGGYLRQALFLNEEDKKKKEQQNFDIRKGWRLPYAKYSSPRSGQEVVRSSSSTRKPS